MSERKTPILLRRSPLTGDVMALTRYTRTTLPSGREALNASQKYDVTSDFDTLMLEELIADDAPDIVAILDGVAECVSLLTADERAQVRAFRERLKTAVERSNARLEAVAA